eukprot:758780-Hanusia_phi.AAC.6
MSPPPALTQLLLAKISSSSLFSRPYASAAASGSRRIFTFSSPATRPGCLVTPCRKTSPSNLLPPSPPSACR